MSEEQNKPKRITWKQAFHLLKRVALQRYRLKYFAELESRRISREAPSHPQQPPPPIAPQPETDKVIYSRRPPDQSRKNYLSIIYLNDQANLRRLDPTGLELRVDELARSIITGIINEIRSRSGSTSPETQSKPDFDSQLIRTSRDKDHESPAINQPFKYVVDRTAPSFSIKNLRADELTSGRGPTFRPGQDGVKKPIKSSADGNKFEGEAAPLDLFLSGSRNFEPVKSVVESRPVKKPEVDKVGRKLTDGNHRETRQTENKPGKLEPPIPPIIKHESKKEASKKPDKKTPRETTRKFDDQSDESNKNTKPLHTKDGRKRMVQKEKNVQKPDTKRITEENKVDGKLGIGFGDVDLEEVGSESDENPDKDSSRDLKMDVTIPTVDESGYFIEPRIEELKDDDDVVSSIVEGVLKQVTNNEEENDMDGVSDGEADEEEEIEADDRRQVEDQIGEPSSEMRNDDDLDDESIVIPIQEPERAETVSVEDDDGPGRTDEGLGRLDQSELEEKKSPEDHNYQNEIEKIESEDDQKNDFKSPEIEIQRRSEATSPKETASSGNIGVEGDREDDIDTEARYEEELVESKSEIGSERGEKKEESTEENIEKELKSSGSEDDDKISDRHSNQDEDLVRPDLPQETDEPPASEKKISKKKRDSLVRRVYSPILFGIKKSSQKDGNLDESSQDSEYSEDEESGESMSGRQSGLLAKTGLSGEVEDERGFEDNYEGSTEFRPLLEPSKSDSPDHDKVDEIPSDLPNENEEMIQDETQDAEATEADTREEDAGDTSTLNRESMEIRPDSQQRQHPTTMSRKKREKEIPQIDESHFYDYDSLVSQPVISEDSNLAPELLQLYHSFGYDCHKRSNLHLIDAETLMFSAGNLVVMLNTKTRQQKYLRTLSGGAVGAIAVHPSRRYFAVGEKGNVPNINIYEYPTLKLYRILRKGTVRGYAYLDFDPTGNLLASLGSAPDYMLTIWDWRQERIVLRTKAFSQDVFKVTFSKDLTGILTSAGSGHIKFWKMASTFTGYKLQGDLGKFGKTEISDIEGYAELPDGKVLSGSEWGNMLLWDGGLIQTEICRKKNKPCHVGPIQQIILNESDVYTIGTDGWVRVWDFETIDSSEPSEEGVKLELEPINELKVGVNVSLRSMVKDEFGSTEDSSIWYVQDSNGGIWRLDLSFNAASDPPKQLFTFHSGSINGIEACSLAHLFATTADDGSVKVFDYINGAIVAQRQFNSSGTCLSWLSTSIDPEGGTIAVGFRDGVLRFLKLVPKNDQQFELVLIEGFKPHTKPIRSIAVDSKNSIIATGSDDPSVFFFSNKKNVRSPIGFVSLPSPVTFMTWTPAEYETSRLLVCMKDGSVYEFDAPVEGKYDTSKSYLIESNLKCRKYTFKSIKSRLRHEEELERKRIEEEERKKREEEERRLRGIDEEEEKAKAAKKGKKSLERKKEVKLEEPAVDGDESGAQKETSDAEPAPPAEDEWKPFIPEVPSCIHWAVYSSPDTFWLSMDDYDAGYLYECRFLDNSAKSKMPAEKVDEPFRAVPVVKSDLTHSEDIPLTCILFNVKKTFCAIGQKNGVIRIDPVPETKKLEDMKHYWSYSFHDCDYGQINRMCLSHDEKFLFSVGADSNIFGILFNASLDDLERARAQKIRLTCQAQIKNASDIDDPMAYSIQEAKLKSESDKTLAKAEAQKQEMRDRINELRRAFKELLDKNDQLVPRLRLGKDEFQIEDSIKQHVYQQVQDKINLTYRELAWQSEKCRLLLDKLKSRFKDVIECDHIVVYTFDQLEPLFVTSFRTVTLPKDMEQYKSELEKSYYGKLMEKQKTKENIDNLEKDLTIRLKSLRKTSTDLTSELDQKESDSKSEQFELLVEQLSASESVNNDDTTLMAPGTSALDQMKRIFGKLRGNTAAKVERALKKMEEKKLKRLKRKKEWKDLIDSRLPDDYENPEDLASIKFAEDNLGDFKLKSSDDYVVPENQRMNVFWAVERLMEIKGFIHKNQMIFNKKLISLRDKKKTLIDEINHSIDRLEQISFLLGQKNENRLNKFTLRPEEEPEKKYEYTREKLLEFKKEAESRTKTGHDDDTSSSNLSVLGGFSSAPAQSVPKRMDGPTSGHGSSLDGMRPIWQNKEIMSPLMRQMVQAKEIRLMFEQKELYKRIEEKMKLFDAELKMLRHDRSRIAIFMKNADLRHVTIYEEFMLLREFEKTENDLELKVNKKKEEHLDMQTKLIEGQTRIDNKRKDIEKLDENYKQLAHTFSHMIREETKYGDFLHRVYKRRIKRKKKLDGQEEDEESEEESIESDSDDEDFNDEDEDSDGEGKEQLDLDICPSGLKQELFDHVCQLREKRLDLDEQIGEEKRVLEQLKKDQDALVKKAKVAENSLKQAQHELENFQREKQKKINNLDIVITLRLSQIEFLKNGRLPADLSAALAFDSRDLDRLHRRIKELQAEKAAEKKLFKSLKERHTNLIRDKKKMDEYVEKLDEVCNKMMIDRFGKLIDIERLELIAVNQQIEELKQRLAENEFDHERIMQEWLNKINTEKDEEIELIKANTSRINEMIDIMSATKNAESRLDAKQTTLGEELAGTNKKEIEERQRLHTLVQLQAQEVEALKAEISILSRKGGHILPPTQPPNLTNIQT